MASKKNINPKTKLVIKLRKFQKALKKKKNKKYVLAVAAISAILGLLYLTKSIIFVAFVNGIPVTRIELIKELEKVAGEETLDALITKKIINQQAKAKGVSVAQNDIQTEIDKISSLIESQGGTLDQALAIQGQTREALEENILIQKTVEKLLAERVTVSDEDVLGYFEENKQYYEEGAKIEDLKGDITDQLLQQKLSTEFDNWINEQKAEANIIYFKEF